MAERKKWAWCLNLFGMARAKNVIPIICLLNIYVVNVLGSVVLVLNIEIHKGHLASKIFLVY